VYNYHCWYTAATERPGASLRIHRRDHERGRGTGVEKRDEARERARGNCFELLRARRRTVAESCRNISRGIIVCEEITGLSIVILFSATFVHRDARIIQRIELIMINRFVARLPFYSTYFSLLSPMWLRRVRFAISRPIDSYLILSCNISNMRLFRNDVTFWRQRGKAVWRKAIIVCV